MRNQISIRRTIFIGCLLVAATSHAASAIRVALASDDPINRADSLPAIRQMLISKGYSAEIVYSSEISTLTAINAYDVVCVGDSGYGNNNWDAYGAILKTYVQGGGGVVFSGWVPYYLSNSFGPGYAALGDILPVLPGMDSWYQGTFSAIGTHPVITGVGTWNPPSYTNFGGGVRSGAIVAGNVETFPAVVLWDYSKGRVVHLASNYFASSSFYHQESQYDGRIPSAQRLLLNAIDWVAGATGPADATAPILTVPLNIVVEATGPSGAAATFTTSAFDDVDGDVAVVLSHVSGSTFPLGTTTITANASDIAGNTATKTFTVTVVDTTAPMIAQANLAVEATSAAGAVAMFNPTANDVVSGLVIVSASAASGSTFPIGTTMVTLSASDSAGNTATKTFSVKVSDTIAPVLTLPPNQILEASSGAGAIPTFMASATDAVGARISYSKNPGATFGLGTTIVTVNAMDPSGNSSSGTFTVTVRDTIAPAMPTLPNVVDECSATVIAPTTADIFAGSVTGTTTDPLFYNSQGTFTIHWKFDDGNGNVTLANQLVIVKDTTAPVIVAPPDQLRTADPLLASTTVNGIGPVIATDNCSGYVVSYTLSGATTGNGSGDASGRIFNVGVTTVTYTVTDAVGLNSSATFAVTILNPTPVVTLKGPQSGSLYAAATEAVTFTATFTDAGGGTHTGVWSFDGVPYANAATITEPNGATGGSATLTRTFGTPGVYRVTLTITDSCFASGVASEINGSEMIVVVYDPSGGFVTGGGWIASPSGAYIKDPSVTGKANFGFVSKYVKGASTPTGQIEFQFKAADFSFHSTSYQWLTVSGHVVQIKGAGQVNRSGNYGFLVTATDGQVDGGGNTDKFRIKVWQVSDGVVVYDNMIGDSDNPGAGQLLGGGSIVIKN